MSILILFFVAIASFFYPQKKAASVEPASITTIDLTKTESNPEEVPEKQDDSLKQFDITSEKMFLEPTSIFPLETDHD